MRIFSSGREQKNKVKWMIEKGTHVGFLMGFLMMLHVSHFGDVMRPLSD